MRRVAEAAGAWCVVSDHWRHGGEGARELAEAVVAACREPHAFKYLEHLERPLADRIRTIVREVYGGDGVFYSEQATQALKALEADPATAHLPVCMAKTQYSLSHDPALLGRPTDWVLPVQDILAYRGAGFVVPVAGEIKLMPGTASDPAFRRIDLNTETGHVKGLF